MTSVSEAVDYINKAQTDTNIRITRRIEIGHAIQQGDIYVFRVPDSHPHGPQIGMGLVQVALGTGNGARHMAEGPVTVFQGSTLPEGVSESFKDQILGPVVVATDTWNLTHPEHPYHRLPAGVYQVVYQMDLRTMKRVLD